MASSKVAFRKFERWKNLKTVLKLTIFTNEGSPPDIWTGRITSVEESLGLLGFVDGSTRDGFALDLSDADFLVDERSIEANRSDVAGPIKFVELPKM